MKKYSFLIALVLMGLLLCPGLSFADDFTVQAYVPPSDGVTYDVSRVSGDTFTPVTTTILDFGNLSVDPDTKILLPDHYWVLDVAPNGSGFPDMDASYTDTANPNGNLNDGTGLGIKGTIAFAEVVSGTPDQVTVIDGMSLSQTNNQVGEVQKEDYADGFLRIIVGIATGDPSLQEGNAEPFTSEDAPGTYSGTLTLTATFNP